MSCFLNQGGIPEAFDRYLLVKHAQIECPVLEFENRLDVHQAVFADRCPARALNEITTQASAVGEDLDISVRLSFIVLAQSFQVSGEKTDPSFTVLSKQVWSEEEEAVLVVGDQLTPMLPDDCVPAIKDSC